MKRFCLIFSLLVFVFAAKAQQWVSFQKLRYDDDFSYLKKDSAKTWYKKLKYTPLSSDGSTYISTGGEVRYQYQYFKNENWGDAPKDNNGYVLTRYLFHTDLKVGTHFRAFFQLQSSLANSRIDPSPVDQNVLDVHQLFFDVNLYGKESESIILRAGRQEMLYGSQRLIAVREGPNNRLAFDGVKAMLKRKNFKTDAFYTHPVANRPEIFNDHFNKNTKLWGSYSTFNAVPLLHNIDLYYLGLWKRNTILDDAQGKERRHSLGTRIWKSKGNFTYDFEGLYQFGKLGSANIKAWTVSSNTAYRFEDVKFKPTFSLKTEAISGNRNYGDGTVETFNPLFPRGAYFGLAALVGPSNMIDLHPSIQLQLIPNLSLTTDCDFFWRMSKNDGIYAPNLSLIYSGAANNNAYTGTQLAANFDYTANDFLSFTLEGTWFAPGDYLKQASPGKNVYFTAVTAQFKF